jgi:hypothetical protein
MYINTEMFARGVVKEMYALKSRKKSGKYSKGIDQNRIMNYTKFMADWAKGLGMEPTYFGIPDRLSKNLAGVVILVGRTLQDALMKITIEKRTGKGKPPTIVFRVLAIADRAYKEAIRKGSIKDTFLVETVFKTEDDMEMVKFLKSKKARALYDRVSKVNVTH